MNSKSFEDLPTWTAKFRSPSLVIINITTAEYYNISKRNQTEPNKCRKTEKKLTSYIKKLHEMLPELKEKYHVSYLGIFGSYIGVNISPEVIWIYL